MCFLNMFHISMIFLIYSLYIPYIYIYIYFVHQFEMSVYIFHIYIYSPVPRLSYRALALGGYAPGVCARHRP